MQPISAATLPSRCIRPLPHISSWLRCFFGITNSINGTQVLSHTCLNLLAELARLQEMGIRHFRLSPQHLDMVAVAQTFRAVSDGQEAPEAAHPRLEELVGAMPFSDGFFHGLEGAARSACLAKDLEPFDG